MPKHTTIAIDRAWNSWSDRPAEAVFLPLGVRITPVLYSTRSRSTSAIEPRHDVVRLGRHATDGSVIDLETDLSGTTLALASQKPDPFVLRGTWQGKACGEWGLRFWISLALSCDGGETVAFDAANGAAVVKVGTRHVALVTADTPVQVTGHPSITALRQDFHDNGYFHVDSRSDSAPVLALRFNLEMMPGGAYAAAVADSAPLAIAKAKAALAGSDAPPLPGQTGQSSGALDAIRDIVGWNTIWDEVNARPYTAVTRIWNLGTFAVWYNDQTYAALLAGVFDTNLARENMAVAHAGATPQGNIACIVTSKDQWVDRSQPPLGSLIAWQLYLRSGERSGLQAVYEALARNQRWWRAMRDPDGSGLISCGTSDVGEGLYKGTHFGARNETGMDNSATHDEAIYDPDSRSLSTWDLGLNCAVALDAEMLANMARVLGLPDDATEFATLAETSRTLIREKLWDDSRGLFANRQRKGGFVRSVSPTSFYPLVCGAASEEQARRLLDHLHDPATFGGDWVLANATRDDPAFADNVYWRGRIWPNVNYMVWLGLRRYDLTDDARMIAEKSWALFQKSWVSGRIAAENYSAVTGEAMDQGDTDPFYIWAGLLPLMAVAEVVDFDPWRGLTLTNRAKDVALGPVVSPFGALSLAVTDGRMAAYLDGAAALSFDFTGTLSDVVFAENAFAARLQLTGKPGRLCLPGKQADRLVLAQVDGTAIRSYTSEGGLTFELDERHQSGQLKILFV
jgi:putative isomerase